MGVWRRLHFLFDTDDGALYPVRLTGLDAAGVSAAFQFIQARAEVTPDAVFWHRGLGGEQRVADHPDPARLVAAGEAEPFHVLARGLSFSGVALPDLGVFAWPDEVTLDYRPGRDWGEPQVLALFELLRQLVAVAPGRVRLEEHARPRVERLFLEAWSGYCQGAPA
jgi:hypothetical protein